MKTKVITAIYFDLHGTSLGGRPSRNDHYLYSLNSIMNISNSEFIIYTNNKSRVDKFYETKYPDKINRYISIEYDLYDTPYKNGIEKIKNIEETKKSVRCIELQYSKLTWIDINCFDCEYIYWIDAGLCYSGLIPDKYLNIHKKNYFDSYYGSDIFTSKLIENMNNFAKEKIIVCAKDNVKNYWDSPIPNEYFLKTPNSNYHIIGGLFGGNIDAMKILCNKFYNLTQLLLAKTQDRLYSEEQILSCLFSDYNELFNAVVFDIWWHEDNIKGQFPENLIPKVLESNKSFYKIIEQFM